MAALEVPIEPGDDPLDAVDAAVRAADEDEQVRLVRVAHHLDGPAELAQRGEDDLRLVGRAAHIRLGLEQEERRLVPLDERGRRAVGEPGSSLGEVRRARGHRRDPGAEVARPDEAREVGDRVLAHAGRKAARVEPEEPVHDVAAVRQAEDAQPPLVAEPFRDGVVDDPQQVVRVHVAPVSGDCAGEVDAVAGGTGRVGVHDGDAGVGEGGHLEPRRRAVGDVRAAVDVEDEPTPPAAPARRNVPRLDLVPVGVRHGEALWVAPPAPEPAAPVPSEGTHAAVLDGADLAGSASVSGGGRDPPAADGEVGADDVPGDEALDRAVEPEAVEVNAPAVGDRRHDAVVVEPDDARLTRGGAVEIAGREERDRAVEVAAEPAQSIALGDVEVVVRPARDAVGGLGDADQAEGAGALGGGDLGGVAAAEREQPRPHLPRPPGEEEERRAVGREPRLGVELAPRQLLRPAAAPRDAPEALPVLAVLDCAPCIDDRLAVGCHRELLHLHLPQEVARAETRLLRHKSTFAGNALLNERFGGECRSKCEFDGLVESWEELERQAYRSYEPAEILELLACQPAPLTLLEVVANYAIRALLIPPDVRSDVACYEVRGELDRRRLLVIARGREHGLIVSVQWWSCLGEVRPFEQVNRRQLEPETPKLLEGDGVAADRDSWERVP